MSRAKVEPLDTSKLPNSDWLRKIEDLGRHLNLLICARNSILAEKVLPVGHGGMGDYGRYPKVSAEVPAHYVLDGYRLEIEKASTCLQHELLLMSKALNAARRDAVAIWDRVT